MESEQIKEIHRRVYRRAINILDALFESMENDGSGFHVLGLVRKAAAHLAQAADAVADVNPAEVHEELEMALAVGAMAYERSINRTALTPDEENLLKAHRDLSTFENPPVDEIVEAVKSEMENPLPMFRVSKCGPGFENVAPVVICPWCGATVTENEHTPGAGWRHSCHVCRSEWESNVPPAHIFTGNPETESKTEWKPPPALAKPNLTAIKKKLIAICPCCGRRRFHAIEMDWEKLPEGRKSMWSYECQECGAEWYSSKRPLTSADIAAEDAKPPSRPGECPKCGWRGISSVEQAITPTESNWRNNCDRCGFVWVTNDPPPHLSVIGNISTSVFDEDAAEDCPRCGMDDRVGRLEHHVFDGDNIEYLRCDRCNLAWPLPGSNLVLIECEHCKAKQLIIDDGENIQCLGCRKIVADEHIPSSESE